MSEPSTNETVMGVVKKLLVFRLTNLSFYKSVLNDIRNMAKGYQTDIRKVHYNLPQHTDEFFQEVLEKLGEKI